jgi:hypothetical protein
MKKLLGFLRDVDLHRRFLTEAHQTALDRNIRCYAPYVQEKEEKARQQEELLARDDADHQAEVDRNSFVPAQLTILLISTSCL